MRALIFRFRQMAPPSAIVVLLGLGITACSKPATVVTLQAEFASADAGVKEHWQAAAQCVGKKDYLGAATNLMAVHASSAQLTEPQKAALETVWLELGNEAFQAADNGNAEATKAVLLMRTVPVVPDRRSR